MFATLYLPPMSLLRSKLLRLATIALPLLAFSRAGTGEDSAPGLTPPPRVVPLSEILTAARRVVDGKVIDVELEVDTDDDSATTGRVDRWVYEVDVLTPDDRVVELEFDAQTGVLLEVEGAPWPAGVPRPPK